MTRAKKPGNLDALLDRDNFDGRFECSATLEELSAHTGVKGTTFERLGLGLWEAFQVSIKGFTDIIVAAPKSLPGAGCSIWFKGRDSFSFESVAAAFSYVFEGMDFLFLNPEDGERIVSDIDGFYAFEEKTEHSILSVPFDMPRRQKSTAHGRATVTKGLYEHVIIARQDLTQAQAQGLIEHFGSVLADNGGKVVDNEYWGVKTMAYKINKNRKGHYAFLRTDAPAAAVQEMERLMRLHDDVMRVLTIKVDAHEDGPSTSVAKAAQYSREIRKH